VLAPGDVDLVAQYADMVQVGARAMHNTPLLRAVGCCPRPVLLKRGYMATVEEFLLAAEYILGEGNTQVVLCERGIRTFEPYTRNTLDVGAIALLNQMTHLPVIADPSHAAGRRDLVLPLARAAIAAGAAGIMVEVHPNPTVALSDGAQALTFGQFEELCAALSGR
jgi:3-deoxy-7-phosphoheptulonate synthase